MNKIMVAKYQIKTAINGYFQKNLAASCIHFKQKRLKKLCSFSILFDVILSKEGFRMSYISRLLSQIDNFMK